MSNYQRVLWMVCPPQSWPQVTFDQTLATLLKSEVLARATRVVTQRCQAGNVVVIDVIHPLV